MRINTSLDVKELLLSEKSKQFGEILENAISSYIENKEEYTSSDWLKSYLSESLDEKSTEEISMITETIIKTVNIHGETMDKMKEALDSGMSAEEWFQQETVSDEVVDGKKAYNLTDSYYALTEAKNVYMDSEECEEVIDVEVIPDDGKWNKYKTKDLVKEIVYQAGETALRTAAGELNKKITECGVKSLISEKEIIKESVLKGADAGLKVAVSGALEVANSEGLLPMYETDTESRSLIACMAIENVSVMSRIANGEIGIVQGLKEIKNTSVATLAAIVKNKISAVGKNIGQRIGSTVGAVFGPVGSAVGHFIGGAVGKMAGTAVGTKIVETVQKVSSVAKSFVSNVRSTFSSIGSTVRSGLKRLFSW